MNVRTVSTLFILVLGPCRAQFVWDQLNDDGSAHQSTSFTIGDTAYTVGGEYLNNTISSVRAYLHASDESISRAPVPGYGVSKPAGFAIGGKGYIATGMTDADLFTNALWIFDPVSNSWNQGSAFPGIPRRSAVGFAVDGIGYVTTGQISGGGYPNDLWAYDPSTDTWTQRADFPGGGRWNAYAFVIGDKAYVGGGSSVSTFTDFWEYDPASDVWAARTSSNAPRVRAFAGSVNEKGYVIGGQSNGGYYAAGAWEYDPVFDAWQFSTDAPQGRSDPKAFVIGDTIYYGGGYALAYRTDFWRMSPGISLGQAENATTPGERSSATVVELTDVMGRTVYRAKPDHNKRTLADIGPLGLTTGMYIIRVSSGAQEVRYKIIVDDQVGR